MRRLSVVISIVVALALALGVAACGTTYGRAQGIGDSPEKILSAAFSSSHDMTTATGGFDFELTADADESQIPAEDLQFAQVLLDGVTVSGTFAYGDDPMTADFGVSLQLAGQPMEVGMRLKDNGLWLNYAGKWYEMPAGAMQEFAGSNIQIDGEKEQQLLEELGFAPVTWFQDLSVVGEEDLAGVNTIHMAGSPDLRKMLADVFGLLQNKEFLDYIDPTGEMPSGMMGSGLPSPAEFDEVMTMVESTLQGLTIDLWVGTDDNQMRKMAIQGHIAPPPGEDPDGLLGIDISGSMWLDSINQPLAIEAPDSPLPFTELEGAIMENPGPLGMLMGGSDFGGGSVSPTIY